MVITKRLTLGISGASGMRIAKTLIDTVFNETDIEVDLIVSPTAKIVWGKELPNTPLPSNRRVVYFAHDNLAAPPASGSYPSLGMAIAPCSMASAARIAHGIDDNLLARAASVALKEKRPLIVIPRETPLSAIHLANLLTLAQAGAVIMPPLLPTYFADATLEEQEYEFARHILEFFHVAKRKRQWE